MKRNRWGKPGPKFLEATTTVRPRFQEVDMLGVVWHGHYLAYFEEARVAFGDHYDLAYQTIRKEGYVAPLVHADVDYLQPARFGEVLHVTARLHPEPGAWITMTYEAAREDGTRLATGRSVQAFTDHDGELVLVRPDFYEAWLQRWEPELREG